MHTFEAVLSVPEAQRHVEVALSLGPAMKMDGKLTAPECIPTAVKPVSRAETVADWLDTPADHCSPLDDY